MLIEKITRQKEWYQIHLDDGTKLLVSEDQLVSMRLLKGQEMTEETVAAIKKNGAKEVGLQLAYNYLSYQLRSKKEVIVYLKSKEIPGAAIAGIITRLEQLNLIDDVQFAKSFVRTQMNVAEKGPTVIAQKLKEKGIEKNLVEESLEEYDFSRQIEIASKLAAAFLKKSSQNSHRTVLQKVNVHLRQKGFNGDVIQEVMGELDFPKDEEREADLVAKLGAVIMRRTIKLPLNQRQQKVKESLFRKGFSFDAINLFLENYDDEED